MAHPFDRPTVDELRARGGLKWSLHPEAIGSFVAEADFGTAPVVAQALHEGVDADRLGYLAPALQTRMAEAFAGFAQDRYGWSVPAERVRPLADVVAGLQAAIEHFSEPGTPVLLPTPAYMPFLVVPRALGRALVEVPMAHDAERSVYDLDALDAAFEHGGLLVLCNPHNPIGRVLEREELLAIAEVVERHGGRVFADEIHAPLVYGDRRHVPYASVSPAAAAHSITAVSASKAWNLPGLKCAQLVLTNEADAARWEQVGFMAEHGASTLGVVAAVAAYEDGRAWLDGLVGYLDGNRRALADLLSDELPEVGYTPPEGTYLGWLDLRATGLGDLPATYLLEHAGVALTEGRLCGRAGAGFARATLATPRPVLEETVHRIAAAVRGR